MYQCLEQSTRVKIALRPYTVAQIIKNLNINAVLLHLIMVDASASKTSHSASISKRFVLPQLVFHVKYVSFLHNMKNSNHLLEINLGILMRLYIIINNKYNLIIYFLYLCLEQNTKVKVLMSSSTIYCCTYN